MGEVDDASQQRGEVTLRVLTEDDWADWRSLRLAALEEAPYAFSATLAEWSGTGDAEDRWRGRLRNVAFNLLAERGGRPLGMVSCTSPVGGEAELMSLWVAPDGRGLGYADALIGAVVDWAASQGCARVVLGVRQANVHAVSAYQRNGFVDAGPAAGGEAGGDPERRMVRILGTTPPG